MCAQCGLNVGWCPVRDIRVVVQAKGPQEKGWWAHCDDEKVTRKRAEDVFAQPAYVLLYQRV